MKIHARIFVSFVSLFISLDFIQKRSNLYISNYVFFSISNIDFNLGRRRRRRASHQYLSNLYISINIHGAGGVKKATFLRSLYFKLKYINLNKESKCGKYLFLIFGISINKREKKVDSTAFIIIVN